MRRLGGRPRVGVVSAEAGEMMPGRLMAVQVLGMATLAVSLFAQTEPQNKIHVESNMLQSPIRAESNLVLVPVFVFDKGLRYSGPVSGWRCCLGNVDYFFALLPSQPYMPKNCDCDVVGLGANDFRVFQDGVEQRIQRLAIGMSELPTRDNMGWHMDRSFGAVGVWSTADLPRKPWNDCPRTFYSLAYAPSNSGSGCHRLEVKVDRPKSLVYARDQYCTGQTPSDPLFSTQYDPPLEDDLAGNKGGKIPVSLQAGCVFTNAGQARVQVIAQFPWSILAHHWDAYTATFSARVAVMGAVRAKDGGLAARFSDLMYPSYWPTFITGGGPPSEIALYSQGQSAPGMDIVVGEELSSMDAAWLPTRYETQVELGPGAYELQLAVSDGVKFGRAEVPLQVESYDWKGLGISSVILCQRFRDAHVAAVERGAANFAPQYVPLVSKNIEVTPAGDTRFHKGQVLIPYFEIYEPLLVSAPATAVQAHFRIIEAKNGNTRDDFTVDARSYEQPGKTVIPMAREVLTDKMPKGAYRLEVQATDSAGNKTPWRTANFTVE